MEDESAGLNCPNGGTAVLAGVDVNGDGVLGDDEVQDISYVCDGAGGGGSALCPGGVIEGDVRVVSRIDAAMMAECTSVTGNLMILALFERIELPLLGAVAGDISVNGTYGAELPRLASIGGNFSIGSGLSGPHAFPMLAFVGGSLNMGSNSAIDALDLAVLASVGGDFSIYGSSVLTRLDAPVLTSVGGAFSVWDNPALATCQVQPILDRLVAAGYAGTATITGNDDAATCP